MRRQQIAEAVLEVVAERGPQALSVAAVAARTGLVPSGIYRHYPSKDTLIDAVLELIESRLLANVEATLEETDDPLEVLRRIVERHVELIRSNSALPRIIFSEEVFGGTAPRRARLLRLLRRYLRRIGDVVRRGQSEHRIRPDADPEAIALLLIGVIQPAVILWHLSDGRFGVSEHAERAWHILRSAIERPSAPRSRRRSR